MKKAIIAMSGGVDSSVCAYIVKNMGLECLGATMLLYDKGNASAQNFLNNTDVTDAKKVADKLGIPFTVYDFKEDFYKQVIERFIASYESGDTPNPCITCNRYIKWQKLFEKMFEMGYDYVVTGHYARIEKDSISGRYLLKKGIDTTKDQSYVLYNMTQDQLSHTLLPLGNLSKAEVRKIAEENNFTNAKKSDSQDICFVPDGNYVKFIEEETKKVYPNGNFIDKDGNILGEHKGLIRYTIGQRKGLGLALKAPAYVCRKNAQDNTVILGSNEDLFTNTLIANDFNWISTESPTSPIKAYAKTRYKQIEQPCIAEQLPDNTVKITFLAPQRAITCGQAVVLYDGDTVVGGGTIIKTEYNI